MILLLDGHNLAFRSFYGMPELTTSRGFPTGALHGWVRTLWMIADQFEADRMVVFFDEAGSARHEQLDPQYKANRDEAPEGLEAQLPYMRTLSNAMGVPAFSRKGVEADELIAATARALASSGQSVRIVSADKDLAQVLGEGIGQIVPPPTANPKLGWRTLDAEGVREKFGVPPERIPDYLALIGDTSDNIPGLAGVGPKTAAKWLQQFGDLEGVLAAGGSIKPPRFQAVLTDPAQAERVRLNLRMVRFPEDTEVDSAWLEPRTPDPKQLQSLLEELEMRKAAADASERYGT
ncbi:MAG: 5'-3' exonuclease H3TH domain-containing protein [Opitutales bacterium]